MPAANIQVTSISTFMTKSNVQTAAGELYQHVDVRNIECSYNGFYFKLFVYEHLGVWYSAGYFHVVRKNNDLPCPFCLRANAVGCEKEDVYFKSIFREVLESKPYRLQALFDFPHVEVHD